MVEVLLFFLLPAITLVIARRRTALKSVSVMLAEYLVYAITLFLVTMLLMTPIGRITVRYLDYGYNLPHISYGKMAIMFESLLCVVLGVGAFFCRQHVLKEAVDIRKKESLASHLAHLLTGGLVLAMLFLSACYMWARRHYGNIRFDEIIFHINMPLQGTDSSFWRGILMEAFLPAGMIFLPLALLMYWPTKHEWRLGSKHRRTYLRVFPVKLPLRATAIIAVLWMCVFYGTADRQFQITSYIENQLKQSNFIEEEYVDPRSVQITFPEKPRNLITVYLESAETSSQDRENGGFFDVNYIPEMTALAKEHVSFSHSDKLEGATVAPATGWTISALVAQTAGLPLKLFHYDDTTDGADNSMSRYAYFMPGATTLGDLLREQGYRNIFMAGSDFTFGGRRAYYTQHGDYEILDYLTAKEQGIIPEDYQASWGFEDQKLYAWAKDVITQVAASDQPFHFSMLTVDTHAPDGYTCSLCPPSESGIAYERPLRCSSRQLGDFIEWCKTQPFYENATIVVTGDHSSMVSQFYGDVAYEKHSGDTNRKIYNVFINAQSEPVSENGRLFTTMDFFATTLAAMGVQIEGDRLGLSTNLFSERKTLAEEYGYEVMFTEMDKKSVFYNESILYP